MLLKEKEDWHSFKFFFLLHQRTLFLKKYMYIATLQADLVLLFAFVINPSWFVSLPSWVLFCQYCRKKARNPLRNFLWMLKDEHMEWGELYLIIFQQFTHQERSFKSLTETCTRSSRIQTLQTCSYGTIWSLNSYKQSLVSWQYTCSANILFSYGGLIIFIFFLNFNF